MAKYCRECWDDLSLPENHSLYPTDLCKKCSSFGAHWKQVGIRQRMLESARLRADKAGVPCTITEEDIKIPVYCPILGLKLTTGTGRGPKPNSASLDRIIPDLGYVPGNIAVISHRANTIKNSGTADEHQKIADWIRSNSPAH